jgi:hypothetical protein
VEIRVDDLQGEAIKALLQLHLGAMHQHSPPESLHALDPFSVLMTKLLADQVSPQ